MSAPSRLLTLSLLRGRYAVVRLAPDAEVPAWATQGEFFSITRTREELSILCLTNSIPSADRPLADWRVLKVHGPFQFDELGVIENLASPLAAAAVGIFVISTFDTDYLLVQCKDIRKAIATLQSDGHTILEGAVMFNDLKENEE